VDLHHIITAEIGHFPSATVHYPGTSVRVLADDLLPEIFTNLIGNSVKFGGPKVEIWINVREDGEKVEVEVTDAGPGIADDLKPHIFHRFQRGPSKKSGRGLGLYITRMLVEHYGGEIRAGDRVPGQPGQGAAIRFTLHRAA
jgi:signal transduction histidine kinase